MNPVGVALVGAGPWGLTLANAFERVPGSQLRWICEVDGQRRRAAAEAHPRAQAAADLAEALADTNVSAVGVAVDSAGHHRVALQALAAGRHV
jgi:predicted dehydrogenase